MKDYQASQYDLQSYFKSLCNTFYLAYLQVKRLEKEDEKLACKCKLEEIGTIECLLDMQASSRDIQNKYFTSKYSTEELEKEKEKLEREEAKYEEQQGKLEKEKRLWAERMWQEEERIERIVTQINDRGYSIIVTRKEEVYALILVYGKRSAKECPIINIDEQYKEYFPSGEKLYEDFLVAYESDLKEASSKETNMCKVFREYF